MRSRKRRKRSWYLGGREGESELKREREGENDEAIYIYK